MLCYVIQKGAFLKIYFYTTVQDPILSGASVAITTKVFITSYHWWWEIKVHVGDSM